MPEATTQTDASALTSDTMRELVDALNRLTPSVGQPPPNWQPGEAATRFVQAPRQRGATSYNAEARTIEAVLASGYRVRRWFGWEELTISETAVDLRRVAMGQVRLIDHHNSYSRDAVLGSLISARVEGGQLIGVIHFADTDLGRAVERDYVSGDMTGFSVGYRINKLVLAETGDEDDVYRAEAWELLEVSSVSVPADPFATARSAHSTQSSLLQERVMPENVTEVQGTAATAEAAPPVQTPAAAPVAPPVQTPAAAPVADPAEVLRSERSRIAELQRIATQASVPAEDLQRAITEGIEVSAFLRTALDAMAARSQENVGSNVRGPGSNVQVLRDEGDTRRTNMTDAITSLLAVRGGDRRATMPENARAYSSYSLVEFAADCIGHRGHIRSPNQAAQVFERAFMTTSDFPALLMDAMNRRLMSRYAAAAPTYRLFCAQYNAADFRPMNILRAGDFPSLQPVNESGEIKSGSFSESKETMRVYPYGVILNLSRQMLVNDNLGAIDQVLGSAGQRITDWENVQAFDVLNANSQAGPTLATDSKAVFHSDHSNLFTTTGAGAVGITTVGAGRAAMMSQETLDGLKANFIPTTLLIGPSGLTVAEQLFTTLTPAQQSNAVPESLRRIVPVGDANVEGTNWYLFADVNVAPCFVYGYLEGQTGPRLSSESPFTMQGLSVKLEHDFGVAGIDYRGAVRNDGAQ